MNSLTLVRKSLLRKKLRFTLLHVVVLVAFLLFGLLASVQHYMSGASLDGANARLIVANAINITRPLPYRYVAELRAMPGVAEVSELSWFGGYYREPKNFLTTYAVDPARLLRLYPELELGSTQRAAFVAERRGILVGRATAAKYGWREGQDVTLSSSIFSTANGSRNWDFVVSGIFANGKQGGDEQSVYLHYDYFNDSRAQGRDQIGSIVLAPARPDGAEALAHAIDSRFLNSSAATSTMSEAQFSRAFLAQFGNIALVVNIVVGTGLVTMLLVLGNTLMMNVRARTREIAVLKALGFSGGRVLALVGGEALGLVGSGAVVGLLLASGLVALLRHIPSFSSLAMPASIWCMGLAAALVLGTLCAAPPALRALRINVASGLRKE